MMKNKLLSILGFSCAVILVGCEKPSEQQYLEKICDTDDCKTLNLAHSICPETRNIAIAYDKEHFNEDRTIKDDSGFSLESYTSIMNDHKICIEDILEQTTPFTSTVKSSLEHELRFMEILYDSIKDQL